MAKDYPDRKKDTLMPGVKIRARINEAFPGGKFRTMEIFTQRHCRCHLILTKGSCL
jgi:hypothetical protein